MDVVVSVFYHCVKQFSHSLFFYLSLSEFECVTLLTCGPPRKASQTREKNHWFMWNASKWVYQFEYVYTHCTVHRATTQIMTNSCLLQYSLSYIVVSIQSVRSENKSSTKKEPNCVLSWCSKDFIFSFLSLEPKWERRNQWNFVALFMLHVHVSALGRV